MRTLTYGGSELVTTDAVAEALLDYVALTPLLVTTAERPDVPLDGEAHAIDVLRHKADRLDSIGYEFHG
jgi:hypothetical protein